MCNKYMLGKYSEMTPAFSYSYADLKGYWRKGLRNGNRRKRSHLDKALYRAALWYLKHHGKIVKASLAEKLSALVQKLKKETRSMRIFKRGFERAVEILHKCERQEQGIFLWAPRLKNWLSDPDYIFWLGLGTVR